MPGAKGAIRRAPTERRGSRAGIGYDAHRLAPGRPLVLGGVQIAFDSGLVAHSDGDVVAHAVMDALLGAAGLPDIGTYFPNTDPQYLGISSLVLLQRVRAIVEEKGWRIVNVDVSLLAEKPRLSPFVTEMRQNVGRALGLLPESVGIKVTTNEGMGFVGRGEGMAAWAVALLETG
ncbi:MAG: 2-C-methyl-D-erythritol 2,4-cyclodiphosphate synthase [Chloroflexi bacterium]|nr:2-C-methyl-D-erythritol 2,4-cyclodiphosphate synthase [Chloroflexota bacterium]